MCSPEEKKDEEVTLLQKLGGATALKAAVNEFYKRLLEDEALDPFFEGINLAILKQHQLKFMSIAFTNIPDDLDVAGLILQKHSKLFLMGLNEEHFDKVATHFVETLQHLGVAQESIDKAVAVIAPLRAVFEQGAKDAAAQNELTKKQEEKTRETLLDKLGGTAALKAAVDEFYTRLLADEALAPFFSNINMTILKMHQLKFMHVAFTTIPDDVDVSALMLEKHSKLFDKGLNEEHFDLVAGHFVATLMHLGIMQESIDEAVGVIAPLRSVFEEGAKNAATRKDKMQKTLSMAFREKLDIEEIEQQL